jgi:hypothetical protein
MSDIKHAEPRFKVGDKVVCVDAGGSNCKLVRGKMYTVTKVHDNTNIAVDNIYDDFDWYANRFDHAKQEVIGDVVTDLVNSPSHYQSASGIECIEAIKAQMSNEEYCGYLRGNVVKYLWRYQQKGGKQSLEKARWYLDKLIGETA